MGAPRCLHLVRQKWGFPHPRGFLGLLGFTELLAKKTTESKLGGAAVLIRKARVLAVPS